MRSLEDINNQIKTLKDQLDIVEGTKTEVYTRIVGYYRSLKNWNKGKRQEYNHRLSFSVPQGYGERLAAGTAPDIKVKAVV
jgi:hypothetical protein